MDKHNLQQRYEDRHIQHSVLTGNINRHLEYTTPRDDKFVEVSEQKEEDGSEAEGDFDASLFVQIEHNEDDSRIGDNGNDFQEFWQLTESSTTDGITTKAQKIYQCEACLKCYTGSLYLQRHRCYKGKPRDISINIPIIPKPNKDEYSLDQEVFQCETCEKCYTSKEHLLRHRCVNLSSDIAVSPVIEMLGDLAKIKNRSDLSKNEELVEQAMYPCRMCHIVFTDLKYLKRHRCYKHYIVPDHQSEKQINTDKTSFKERTNVEKNIPSKIENDSESSDDNSDVPLYKRMLYACNICHTVYCTPTKLSEHAKCHKNLKELAMLKSLKFGRVNLSKNKKSLNCPICAKVFQTYTKLKRHVRTHTQDRNFSCTLCEKAFPSVAHLDRHVKAHTGEKPFKCTMCDKLFSQPSSLATHIRSHTGEKPYACTLCGRIFTRADHLTVHKRSHTGEKPFACLVCGKSFNRSGNLNIHMMVHTGEKRRVCPICGKTFSTGAQLTRHSRKHTGERPFACSMCCKTYTQASSLARHMRCHTGEKPYACPVCSKSFAASSSLDRHMLCHTADRPHPCSLCDKSFTCVQYLTKHKRKVHKIRTSC